LNAREDNPDVVVVWTEGEKPCKAATLKGLIATTTAHGAKSPGKTDCSALAGMNVALTPDADKAGDGYALTMARILSALNPPAKVKIVRLPGLPPKGDFVEYVQAGGTAETFMELVKAALEWKPATPTPSTHDVPQSKTPTTELRGLADFPLTDAGNGEQIFHRHGQRLRSVALWKKWIVFGPTHWEIDETGTPDRLALETMRAMKRLGARMAESEDDAEHARGIKLQKFAHACESHKKLKDMLSRAATVAGASIMPAMLDADPWLLNVKNGTLDLHTGELRPHRREDFITKLAPVVYDASQDCPTFLAFMNRIFADNQQLIGFVQRFVGYTLSGITVERVFLILFGAGRNGKSTLMGVIRDMLGHYATQTAADTLMVKRNEGIPNDIARFKGARFVSATESDEGRHLAEGLIKRMTGGEDVLTARFMRAEFFDFRPEFKLWLATNHRPVIRGTDPAIWDRIMLIPFEVRIPDEEVDRDLPVKLRAELPGILTWAVRGCLEWQRNGLQPPQEVRAAVESYREDMDRLGDFITECCTVGTRCQSRASALYDLYKTWCALNGEEAMNQTRFGRQLTDRGYPSDSEPSGNYKLRLGIEIRATE